MTFVARACIGIAIGLSLGPALIADVVISEIPVSWGLFAARLRTCEPILGCPELCSPRLFEKGAVGP